MDHQDPPPKQSSDVRVGHFILQEHGRLSSDKGDQDNAHGTKQYRHYKSLQGWCDFAAIWILRLCLLASLLVMIGVSTMGFCKMYKGFREAMASDASDEFPERPYGIIKSAHPSKMLHADDEEERKSAKALHHSVSGLEYLFLAPLSFLILRGLSEYIEDLYNDKRSIGEIQHRIASTKIQHPHASDQSRVTDRDLLSSRLEGSAVRRKTKEGLLDAKALTIGLLFAMLATHLVGRLITGASHDPEGMESLKVEGLLGSLLLLLLGGLYFGVEKLSEGLKAPHQAKPEKEAK